MSFCLPFSCFFSPHRKPYLSESDFAALCFSNSPTINVKMRNTSDTAIMVTKMLVLRDMGVTERTQSCSFSSEINDSLVEILFKPLTFRGLSHKLIPRCVKKAGVALLKKRLASDNREIDDFMYRSMSSVNTWNKILS